MTDKEKDAGQVNMLAASMPDYLPGKWCWLVILLGVATIGVIRLVIDDPSYHYIFTAIGTSAIVISVLIWFVFRSSYPRALRALVAVLTLAALVVFPLRYRVLRFSGGMFPQFTLRTAKAPDELLDAAPQGVPGVVDLSPTEFDFPQFLGPNRNAQLEQIRLNRNWVDHPPKLIWKQKIGAGWSAFAAVNGFAITLEQRGPSELMSCYRVSDGKLMWASGVNARHDTALGFVGPRSTPTIFDGRVYAMGATGILRCLDGADGSEVWSRDWLAELGLSESEFKESVSWGRSGSPLVFDGRLYVPVGGRRAGQAITMAALDLETGVTVWESGTRQIAYASPTYMNLHGVDQIVNVNEDWVTSHDADTGDILWEHPWPGSSTGNANCPQPVQIDDRRVLLTKGYTHGAELIQLLPGDDEWQVDSVWRERVMKTKFSSVAIHEGFIYGLDDGVLSCVELETGRRRWKKGRFGYGQNLLVGDLLLVLSEQGELALVAADPDNYTELGRIQALDGQTWNTICLYGNSLLIRNAEEAACYELSLEEELGGMPNDE